MAACFNSRSREGSDRHDVADAAFFSVSIRAPARGATNRATPSMAPATFQFALPRGERPRPCLAVPALQSFNSRSREGSDKTGADLQVQIARFQFALPRGERLSPRRHSGSYSGFQFALPRGERLSASAMPPAPSAFQFALPRGERRSRRASRFWKRCFNSRSREGSDFRQHVVPAYNRSFNSRSREGSDRQRHVAFFRGIVSIRAPARGATLPERPPLPALPVSIRAPARGATLIGAPMTISTRFQFALPRGERRWPYTRFARFLGFNSRSREGSDFILSRPLNGFHSFNSRSREGSDGDDVHACRAQVEFQFALPRGERRCQPIHAV